MWQFIFIIGISYAGVFVEANSINSCDPRECDKLGPKIDPGNVEEMLPVGEKLLEMCPSILAMLECSEDTFANCMDSSFFESMNSENETLAAVASIYQGVLNLFTDLCDKDSDLHKRYARNIVCIRNVVMNPMSMSLCALEARTLYGAYSYGSEEERHKQENECMTAAHVFACSSADVMEECGEEARSTLVEMVKRTKILKHVCSMEDFVSLKAKYIEFLELEANRKSAFEKAFDFRKRK